MVIHCDQKHYNLFFSFSLLNVNCIMDKKKLDDNYRGGEVKENISKDISLLI